MKSTLSFLTLFFLVVAGFSQVQLERQVIGSAGTSASQGNLQLEYTVGEAVVTTESSGSIILTQGFNQPGDISIGFEAPDYGLSINAFPNPTSTSLRLEVEKRAEETFDVVVYNELGQQLGGKSQHIAEGRNQTLEFDFSEEAAGHYYIEIRTDQQSVQSIPVQVIR